ncbi:hypothetical protein DBR37_03780 [Herminiimonas sp. KBW02]|nr:hypothetical protein DBR37_03780 [Herminiimonas sp. KBW02]
MDLHFKTSVNNAKTAPGLGIWRMSHKVDGCCENAAARSAQVAGTAFAVTIRVMRALTLRGKPLNYGLKDSFHRATI